jgi:hypothetical protein
VYDVLPKPRNCYSPPSVPFHALHATQRILMRLRAFCSVHWLFEFSAYSMPSHGSSCLPSCISSIRGMAGRWGRPIPALDPLQPLRDMARKILKNKSDLVVAIRTPIHYPPCRSCVAVRGAGSTSSLTTEERPNCFGKNARMHVARPRVRSVGSCLAEMASTDPCMPATGELNNSPPRRITQRLKPFADFGHMVQIPQRHGSSSDGSWRS